MTLTAQQQSTHDHALLLAKNFGRLELELISVLQQVEQEKVYLALAFNSLFDYATKALGLSEANSYSLIAIARKSREIPELKSEIEKGKLSVSKAARIVSVITPQNKTEWIRKAESSTKAELEREVVKEKPEEVRESVRVVAEERLLLRLGITPAFLKKLKRAQVLVANKNRKPVSMEDALEATLDLYLEKCDPVVRAERAQAKAAMSSARAEKVSGGVVKIEKKRQPIPAAIKHAVFQRDRGECCYTIGNQRCRSAHFTEVHHRTPVASGGDNSLENLVTLCARHHKFWHEQVASTEKNSTFRTVSDRG